jgi:mono/diheme cytochrome c family protein
VGGECRLAFVVSSRLRPPHGLMQAGNQRLGVGGLRMAARVLAFTLAVLAVMRSASAFMAPQGVAGPRHALTRQLAARSPVSESESIVGAGAQQTCAAGKGAWSFRLLAMLPAMLALLGLGGSSASAYDSAGVKLFEENCASCHVGGRNVIG